MGRAPCCDKATVKKGPWSAEEDSKLKAYMEQHGPKGNWIALPQKIGLKRCGKSCRLRWLNYLSPNIKRGKFTEEDDDIIYSLYNSIGSRWSVIAAQLPGRTDNDIKNYWNTKLKKKLLEKLKDQHNRHLAAAEVVEAKQNEVNDLKSYIPSQTNLGPYEYETKPTAQVDEHTNINMNCPYVDFDPEIVSRLLEQANCSQVYTIADTSPITQSATFQLNLQQAFDNQIFQLDNDTSVRMVKERLEDNLIDLVNSMNMTSTSQMEASNCINKNSNISQTQNSTVGVAAQISYQTAPAPPLEYTTWIEDHVKLECPTVLGTELPEIVNSPVFPPISCGSPDGNYESGWMNTFNAQNNMNLNMEANEFLMDRNDLLYSTKTNSSLFFERGEGKYGYGSFLEGQMI